MDLSILVAATDIYARLASQAQQAPPTDILIDTAIAAALIGLGLLALAMIIIARRDEALRNSQARLSAIIDTAIDGIITIDQKGVIRSCNPAAGRLFGYVPDGLLGESINVLMPSPYRDNHDQYLQSYLRTGDARIIGTERELVGRRQDGSTFPIMLALAEVRLSRQRFFTGIVRDITEQKQSEQAEREQRLLAEVLRDTAAALNSTLALESVIDNILTMVSRVVPHDAADLILIDGDGPGLTVISRSGQMGYYKRHSGRIFPVTMTPELEQMLRRQQSLLIPDLADDPHWAALQQARGSRAYLGASINLGGRPIGFINLDSQTPGAFTASHASRLEVFANQAAAALENARLYREIEAFGTSMARTVEERTTQLQRAKERVESILNNSPDAILLLDQHARIQTCNSAVTRLFGYSVDDIFGQSPIMLLSQVSARSLNRMIRTAAGGKRQGRFEVVARHKDGTTFDADLAISSIPGDNGIQGLVCSLRDIRALKQVERMKDAFVSNVSHELRTPITSLKLFLRLLLKVPPEEYGELVPTLNREADRLQNIITDVLNLSRLDQGSIHLRSAEENLNPIIEQYVSDRALLARSRGIWLKLRLAADLPPIWVDAGLVGQALNVLISNALNYTPANGEVEVTTGVQRRDRREWVVCNISDTGPGIAPSEQEYLFQRFFRGRTGRESAWPGAGLGLSIAREIMDRHGGRISVASEGVPGKGATFSLWFPVKKTRRARLAEPAQVPQPVQEGATDGRDHSDR